MRFAAILALSLALPAIGGCPHGADERARLDTEVGRAAAAGLNVVIADGRAAVRELGATKVVLWGGAPSIDVTLQSDTARQVELIVHNVMPNVREASGLALADHERPTAKRATVDLVAGSPRTLRIAPDDEGSREPFRVVMFADVQEAIDSVGDVFGRMNADPRVRFAVMNGDQTSRGSREELLDYQRALAMLNVPCFMTLGNHELGNTESLYREIFGRGNHHFTYRGAHFTLLDSASATVDPMVYPWLEQWLAEARGAVHLVSMHIPPFDPVGTRNGAFASRAEAAKLIARLRAGRVDATYYGHVHSYYAYANGEIPAFISGGGGAIPERMDGIGRNYLTVDVDPVKQIVETALVRVD